MSNENEKRIVTLGGGTGTFVVLSGLRRAGAAALTAIVSASDDGGSTGHLRDAYGVLPPGDARQALIALAEEGPLVRELFAYRFSKGDVAGHNLGNLFITALADLLGSDAAAITEASHILRITGRVLSVSDRAGTLRATLSDGSEILGEHAIDVRVRGRAAIQELALAEELWISPAARRAIIEADLIVLGPGDLYSSTIASLLPTGVSQAIQESSGKLVGVLNLFTKAGQTEGYTAARSVAELERYAGRKLDAILVHTGTLPEAARQRYAEEGEFPLEDDLGNDPRVLRLPLASVSVAEPVPEDPVPRSLVRHDTDKLADALLSLV